MGKKYIKCPRCELNYILEGEDYCNVCKFEMQHHSEQEEDELLDFDEMDICSVCGTNYIKENETMCSECREKMKKDKSSKNWEDDEESIVSTDADEEDDVDDDYNSGFSSIDADSEETDPYKIDDDTDDDALDFAFEEDLEESFEEEMEDDFETVDASDYDDDEDEDDDNIIDEDEDDDFISKK